MDTAMSHMHKQVLATHIPHEIELSITTVTVNPIRKSMLAWPYYTVWVTVKPILTTTCISIYMQAKQCNSTHYILTHYLNPFWPIHPIPFPPGEMPQEVMSYYFCVHSAKSGLRSSMLCPFLCTPQGLLPWHLHIYTINFGASNCPMQLIQLSSCLQQQYCYVEKIVNFINKCFIYILNINIYNSAVNIYICTYIIFLECPKCHCYCMVCLLWTWIGMYMGSLCSSQLVDANYFALDKVPFTVFHSDAATKEWHLLCNLHLVSN